ncbi:hypothetical protein [Agrococcus baldri]|uniref:ATP-grasp domain-containing protein n=1 Tax=Agrococcus baldri TaxID=153730 RepID=A0AA87RAY3_9MICO|nr:hypothetical protein [Agrococcus baldri]GEK79715.1 hypothetical protein ABA31_10660 [Agrococcus baldri]
MAPLQPVERSIREHVARGTPLNETDDPGRHAAYVVEAAERRGLRILQVGRDHYCFLGPDGAVGAIKNMVTSLTSDTAVPAANSKHISKLLFQQHGVPVPRGQRFGRAEYERALAWLRAAEGPVVLKPDAGRGGEAVTVGVTTEDGFARAWRAATASKESAGVLVEEQASGVDVRVLVVEGRAVAAASRIPAFVVGDGRSSVEALVAAKGELRRRHAYLARLPILADEAWLARLGHSFESVPGDGEIVIMNGAANLSQGGEHVNVTARVHPDALHIAERAAASIPGMGVAGIDLLLPSLDSAADAVVLEANTGANLSIHHVPGYGEPVDVAGAIVDAMLARETASLSRWRRFRRSPAGKRLARLARRIRPRRAG